MSIRAFVGHSFTEGDQKLVNQFLVFLESIHHTLPSFSWVHAENPEAREVPEKVLSLIEDRNLFIAICTKKERAIAPEKLHTPMFGRGKVAAKADDLEWKTSDWIIQEIGLAIGRRMRIILLIENGVRSPGALQGNLEYISFERSSPEKAFTRLLEMIAALAMENGNLVQSTQPAVTAAPPTEENRQPESDESDNWTPRPEWTKRQYQHAYLHFIFRNQEERATEIAKTYLNTPEGKRTESQAGWSAYQAYMQMLFCNKDTFDELKALLKEHPKNSEVLEYLAKGYLNFEDSRTAAPFLEQAARCTKSTEDAIKLFGDAAFARLQLGNVDEANRLLDCAREKVAGNEELESALLRIERKLSQETKEALRQIAAMERLLEINPADESCRFDLAYKYSEIGIEDLALHHYSMIPYEARSGATWNNLGVAYENLGLTSKAVEAYRSSEEKGGTLASSNLAFKLLHVGFIPEAREICERAMKINDYDKNLDKALARVHEIPEEEQKKRVESLDQAKKVSLFFKSVGHSLALSSPSELGKEWNGPDCHLKVTHVGRDYRFYGEYESKAFGLGLLATANPGTIPQPVRFAVEYLVVLNGQTLQGTVARKRIGEATSASTLLASGEPNTEVLMFLTSDSLEVLERAANAKPRYYKLVQKNVD